MGCSSVTIDFFPDVLETKGDDIMNERLENIKSKYEELKIELTKPEVLSDFNKLKKLSKEQKDKTNVCGNLNKRYVAKEKHNKIAYSEF